MCEISIVMPVYNAEKYVKQAIESAVNQSFDDFEFIIINDGSTDKTRDIVCSYDDNRIKLIENEHDFINSLNKGLEIAHGKYFVRMDADDIMHIDRLKIQHAIMEAKPEITVCSTWMIPFGENIPKGAISSSLSGFIDYPLLHLLRACIFFHPTIMMRADFFRQHHQLKYDRDYIYAEDYKLWTEVAKQGGVFYIETQPLLYYRVSDSQISNVRQIEQRNISEKIKKEILAHFFNLNKEKLADFSDLEKSLRTLIDKELMTEHELVDFYYTLFSKNKNTLNLRC